MAALDDVTYLSVVSEIFHYLIFIQPSVVFILQRLRQVPMIQCLCKICNVNMTRRASKCQCTTHHERLYAGLQQHIYQVRVELKTLLVHGIVSSAVRDDSTPADGEAVRFHVVFFQQSHILLPPRVRVRRDVSISTIFCFARQLGERVPYRGTPPVDVCASLDLIGSCKLELGGSE